ncbi:hypothetical protein GCK32_021249 [Trichostrongylus colubriformis]|uniref:Uncharacterized protein n=1 Tax=Trichostrongylus colubriformis TaxID=6319 RepID=A0AAN8G5I0_TRICO
MLCNVLARWRASRASSFYYHLPLPPHQSCCFLLYQPSRLPYHSCISCIYVAPLHSALVTGDMDDPVGSEPSMVVKKLVKTYVDLVAYSMD